jgi:arsenate reductase-like glutaredoxin family protein
VTCARAQEFLSAHGVESRTVVSANQTKLDAATALEMARRASRIVVSKGRKTIAFDMKKNPPDEETLLAALLGPTGNMRAPSVLRGTTLLVGFSPEMYGEAFGARSASKDPREKKPGR